MHGIQGNFASFFLNVLIDYCIICQSPCDWACSGCVWGSSKTNKYTCKQTHWDKQSPRCKPLDTCWLLWVQPPLTLAAHSHIELLPPPSISLSLEWPLACSLLGGLEPASHFRHSVIWEANDKAEVYRRGFAHSPKFAFKGPQVIFRLI